ncbi:LacI family DNA-binding transcriptional regulator [Enterococcus sp. OL5]|uniref:LacI family DNA-binding transcriptional regulator n=1 Tax=Enterococcus sp. OL5 TaxID=2590214 RepID=UPI00112CF47A|nr:LacI family DNA-binding transcriptional regulator [Enterococcus sp. OL5]TPR55134.1 LacI family transcriptional regulator [Enterococcus sp. OL5]
MASIRDVAQLAGVSVGTVSRYLNGQQLKQSNMEKIASAIETLDYKENIIAKGLKNNRSFSLGLLMNSISSRFGSEVVSGIEKVAEENGYSLLLSGFSNSPKKNEEKVEFLLKHAVDGVIVFLSGEECSDIMKLTHVHVPIVSLNSPDVTNVADVLLLNDHQSVFDVISHYLAAGHKKIGYLSAPQSDHTAGERLSGAQAAMANGEAEMKIVVGDYTRQSGYRGTEELVEWGATAIFVSNYNMSVGALECFNQKGLIIGKDIVFGHYDYLSEAEQSLLSQITVNPPAEQMGEKAAKLVLERIKTGRLATEKQVVLMENHILGLPRGAE